MEYKSEFKLKGNRIIVKVKARTFDKNGIVLPNSMLSYFDTMQVVKVGDAIQDIKVGDEVVVDYYSYQRVQPFTLDSKEGLDLSMDIDAVNQSSDRTKISIDKYEHRLIQYHDIVAIKSN